MYCQFGTSLPKGALPLPSFEHPALRRSGCALRTSFLSSCIDHTEDSGCSVLSHVLMRCQQSTSISQPLGVWKNEWLVYVVMNQAVWILEVKDIWCHSHVNNHIVTFPPQSHTFEHASNILYPIDMYISLYLKMPFWPGVQFKAMEEGQKAQKLLYLKFLALTLNKVIEISQKFLQYGVMLLSVMHKPQCFHMFKYMLPFFLPLW